MSPTYNNGIHFLRPPCKPRLSQRLSILLIMKPPERYSDKIKPTLNEANKEPEYVYKGLSLEREREIRGE